MTEHGAASRHAELAFVVANALAPDGVVVELPDRGAFADGAARRRDGEIVVVTTTGAAGAVATWVEYRHLERVRIVTLGPTERLDRVAAALKGTHAVLEQLVGGRPVPVEPWAPPVTTDADWERDAWLRALYRAVADVVPVGVTSWPDAVLVESAGVTIGGRADGERVVGVDPRDWAMRRELGLDEEGLLAEARLLARRLRDGHHGRSPGVESVPRAIARRSRATWLEQEPLRPFEPDRVREAAGRAWAWAPDGTVVGFGRAVDPWLPIEARALAGDWSSVVRLVVAGSAPLGARIAEAFGPCELIEETP